MLSKEELIILKSVVWYAENRYINIYYEQYKEIIKQANNIIERELND